MYSLFIDTHFSNLTIGIFFNDILIDFKTINNLKNTSEFTMPVIKDILKKNNCDIKNLKKVIVCNGPGSFTGVRVAVTIAKILSYLLNIQIYTINSLELVAISNNLKDGLYAVRENNGIYIARLQNGKFLESITYKKNSEILNNKMDIIYDDHVNIGNLLKNDALLHLQDCFNVKPLYVKNTEFSNYLKGGND